VRDELVSIGEKIEDADLVNMALNGIPKSREPLFKGVCARESIPDWQRIWDDCIQEETREESKGNKQGRSEENLVLAAIYVIPHDLKLWQLLLFLFLEFYLFFQKTLWSIDQIWNVKLYYFMKIKHIWKKGHTLKQLLKRELGIQRGWPSGKKTETSCGVNSTTKRHIPDL
jgi:hypothetical protein